MNTIFERDLISVNEMSSPWMPHDGAAASPQISPRSHHHIQEFSSSIGKIFRGLRKSKKHQSQQLFVPAGPLPQIPTGSLSTGKED